MIKGVHTMFYSSDVEALRAFIRDKLRFPCTDVGGGWLIFDLPEAEMGCHESDTPGGAPSGTPHISFYCDDLQATIAELKARGVEFTDEVSCRIYGLVIHFKMPGNFEAELYQPHYRKNSGEVHPDLVVLRTYSRNTEAEVARATLAGSGIDALVDSDDCGGMQPFLQLARGVRLSVRSRDVARAEEILAQPSGPQDESST